MTPRPPTTTNIKEKATPTHIRARIGRPNIRNLYLYTEDKINLYRGLTEVKNGGKLCYNTCCAAVKHPQSLTCSLLPFHAYLILPGFFIIHHSRFYATRTSLLKKIKTQPSIYHIRRSSHSKTTKQHHLSRGIRRRNHPPILLRILTRRILQ